VFPHLVTLERPGYLILPFAATQESLGAVAALSRQLPTEVELYVHTEQFVVMCRRCWEEATHDHAEHGGEEHHVVRGKLCAPAGSDTRALRRALDDAVAAAGHVGVFVPELSRLAGDPDRAEFEARRMAMLAGG
jgi:hypothetical protein